MGRIKQTNDKQKKDRKGDAARAINKAADYVQNPRFYGKFRAYLFINFGGIALILIMLAVSFLLSGESEGIPIFLTLLLFAAGSCLICYLLWRPVSKKVDAEERKLVFAGFFSTGILVFGKVLLACTIILIPLAMHIGGEYEYEYRYVTSGLHAGSKVLCRRKWDGTIEDIYGNTYTDA